VYVYNAVLSCLLSCFDGGVFESVVFEVKEREVTRICVIPATLRGVFLCF